MLQCTVSQEKKHDTIFLSITSPNVDWFSKFFHQQTRQYKHVIKRSLKIYHSLNASPLYLVKRKCQNVATIWNKCIIITINFNFIYIAVNNVLTNLCYTEYSKRPHVARMQAWSRQMRRRPVASSIALCFTPAHTANRSRFKSFTHCTAVWQIMRQIV